ncbi:DUF2961 domain-containing protein [bacterium]|nr:DUF2961 domain-containing protein [bacterium]
MKRILFACVLMGAFVAALAASPAGAFPIGLELLQNPGRLPEPRIPSLARQVSSHDRTGGNEDGFLGTYAFLYYDQISGEFTLLDEKGEGCVSRMWFTLLATSGDIRIYIDDAPAPVVAMPIEEFLSGAVPPFLSPLTGDNQVSSGGFYNYVPICFKQAVRIATTGLPHFNNITYERFAPGTVSESFTGLEDFSNAIALWETPAQAAPDLPPPAFNGTVTADPGDDHVAFFTYDGAGVIREIRVTPPLVLTDDFLRKTVLSVTFDGAAQPQILAPLGGLFAVPYAEADTRALLAGVDETGDLYIRFPMPFFLGAEFSITNIGDTPVSFDIAIPIDSAAPEIHTPYFQVTAQGALTASGSDYIALDATGRGHFVGLVLDMTGTHLRYYLEGDERVHIDGSRSPSLYGTGTEDYFNAGWYFEHGVFTLPAHGFVTHRPGATTDTSVAYRLHVADPLPFHDGFRFGIEHDYNNLVPDDVYFSTAFWYGAPDPAIRLDAEVDIGEGTAKNARAFEGEVIDGEPVALTAFFEGDADDIPFTDDGYNVEGEISVVVTINPRNEGLLLRRRMDAAINAQRAQVYVDGVDAGAWQTRGRNVSKRWRDERFLIAPELTAGKTQVELRFVRTGPTPWTIYQLWVHSVVTPLPSRLVSIELTREDGDAPAAVGETVRLSLLGAYLDGTIEDVSAVADWSAAGAGHEMNHGYFTPFDCGAYVIGASAGGLDAAPLTVSVDCGGEDDDDFDDDLGDDDDDGPPDAGDDDALDDDDALEGDDDDDGCGC